eukprot:scaffold56059_cov31-Tisochrysis_lutea.AAC.4
MAVSGRASPMAFNMMIDAMSGPTARAASETGSRIPRTGSAGASEHVHRGQRLRLCALRHAPRRAG